MAENFEQSVEKRKKRNYKWCFVPLCNSNSISSPSTIFVSVPKGEIRRKWFEVSGRTDSSTSLISSLFCCEHHFNLEEDVENYMRVRFAPNTPIRLKKGVMPTKFACQPSRQSTCTSNISSINIDHPSTSSGTVGVDDSVANISGLSLLHDTRTDYSFELEETSIPKAECKSVGTQVKLQTQTKHFRSKEIQCVPIMKDASCSTEQKLYKTVVMSKSTSISTNTTDLLDNTLDDCDSEYLPLEETSEEMVKEKDFEQQRLIRNMKISIIRSKPKMYLGIPDDAFFVIEYLYKVTSINISEICLTLSKIKSNDQFARIADEFGVSVSNASSVFRRTLPILSHYLKTVIIWPSKDSIKKNLPVPFRARYSQVQSIIDCLEIEIQKPGKAINQSVTWFEYKKCNTIKYLISMTPDGVINFVSEGFCGRTTDVTIVELSGYLNVLPDNTAIMADRGFKNIDHFLQKKGCTLIRPPSVSSNSKPTADEVMETRRIASLRIHVERVIRRIREFHILKPHSTIHHDMLDLVDDMIIVAAGLINLQPPVIAQ